MGFSFGRISQKPYRVQFVNRVEEAILSGQFEVGERLPSEREMANAVGVSRPIVHDGLLDLEQKGLIEIRPRQGSFVLDFRRNGSLDVAVSLLRESSGVYFQEILENMLNLRMLLEPDTATQAAERISLDGLNELQTILNEEIVLCQKKARNIAKQQAEKDYCFHHQIATASGNILYPLLMNSFKEFYIQMLEYFYDRSDLYCQFVQSHIEIVDAIKERKSKSAGKLMSKLLDDAEIAFRKGLERGIDNGKKKSS